MSPSAPQCDSDDQKPVFPEHQPCSRQSSWLPLSHNREGEILVHIYLWGLGFLFERITNHFLCVQGVRPIHRKHLGPVVRVQKAGYRGKALLPWPLSCIACKLENSNSPYIRGCCEDKILNTRRDLGGAWDEWPCVRAIGSSVPG